MSLVIDLVLLAVLLFFIWLGAHRGFIMTLCSLVAVLVALVGANLLADTLSPRLAEALEPKLQQSIQESLEEKALAANSENGLDVVNTLAVLREKGGLYEWAADALEGTLQEGFASTVAEAAATAATAIAQQLAHGLIFLIGFFVVLLLWTLLSHALNLVARLPGLSGLNRLGGGVLGALKGLLILYVCAWALCTLTSTIPTQTVEGTKLLSLLLQHSPLEMIGLIL
jgi:uncharacterized membrane protein required for colicin V production